MFKARRTGQHAGSHSLYWPQVILIVGEPEWMRVAVNRLASQEVDFETFGVNGRLVLTFLAVKRGIRPLQHTQHG